MLGLWPRVSHEVSGITPCMTATRIRELFYNQQVASRIGVDELMSQNSMGLLQQNHAAEKLAGAPGGATAQAERAQLRTGLEEERTHSCFTGRTGAHGNKFTDVSKCDCGLQVAQNNVKMLWIGASRGGLVEGHGELLL